MIESITYKALSLHYSLAINVSKGDSIGTVCLSVCLQRYLLSPYFLQSFDYKLCCTNCKPFHSTILIIFMKMQSNIHYWLSNLFVLLSALIMNNHFPYLKSWRYEDILLSTYLSPILICNFSEPTETIWWNCTKSSHDAIMHIQFYFVFCMTLRGFLMQHLLPTGDHLF